MNNEFICEKKKAPVRYRKKDYQENSLTLKMI